jgi:hypothetical protein
MSPVAFPQNKEWKFAKSTDLKYKLMLDTTYST